MKYLLSSTEMKQCDENTMEYYGMLSAVLMERAALATVEELENRISVQLEEHSRENTKTCRVLVACGTGNNGGDGFAVARLLHLKGYAVDILFQGKEERFSVEARRQFEIAEKYEISIRSEIANDGYDIVVDALFGIGLCREITGAYADLITKLNALSGYKVAVDIPSGVSADDGAVLGVAFIADLTVTFGFAKLGQMLYPGAQLCGEVVVKDIGIDAKSLCDIRPKACMLEASDLSLIPKRSAYSNKGSYGKILIFAGSVDMAGAAAFSAKAAYATGAGLVKVVTRQENREVIHNLVPEAVLATYGDDTDMERFVRDQLSWADVVVAGPGIGRSQQAEQLVKVVLGECKVPCVLDADGLNIAAKHREWLLETNASVIVTPHLGEMSRLCDKSIAEIQKNIISIARSFAKVYHVITVLKDARTIISTPDGYSYVNPTGNHGMATGGCGDVLTGIIAALIGQKLDPKLAAPIGVYLHGMAGDYAAADVGMRGLMASDLIMGIREVWKEGSIK